MTDTTLNRFLSYGTNAQRLAFTPSVPTPASGPSQAYFWFETDTGDTYAYAGGVWTKVNTASGAVPAAITQQPYWPPSSANAMDDEFTAGSLNTATLWTWQNQGTRTATLSKSHAKLSFVSPGAGDNWGHITQPAPATPWTMETRIAWNGSTSSNFTYGGLVLRESGTGKFIAFALDNSGISPNHWTNNTTFGSGGLGGATYGTWPAPFRGSYVYLRAQDDGTNLVLTSSIDGVTYQPIASEGRTVFMAGGPNQVGLGFGTNIASGTCNMDVDYFRRIQ